MLMWAVRVGRTPASLIQVVHFDTAFILTPTQHNSQYTVRHKLYNFPFTQHAAVLKLGWWALFSILQMQLPLAGVPGKITFSLMQVDCGFCSLGRMWKLDNECRDWEPDSGDQNRPTNMSGSKMSPLQASKNPFWVLWGNSTLHDSLAKTVMQGTEADPEWPKREQHRATKASPAWHLYDTSQGINQMKWISNACWLI